MEAANWLGFCSCGAWRTQVRPNTLITSKRRWSGDAYHLGRIGYRSQIMLPEVVCAVEGGPVPEDDAKEEKEEIELFKPSENESATATDTGESGKYSEIPLFPLQVVLNPGTPIPLHIFELRYRLLFNRIRDGDSRFGIVMYDKETESLARVGCCAELIRFEPMPDGRIMTNNVGRERFRIVKILEEKPYIRAVVEYINDEAPKENYEELESTVWKALQDVLRLSNKLYDKVLDLSPEIKRLAPTAPASAPTSTSATAPTEGKTNSQKDIAEAAQPASSAAGKWPDARRMQDFSFAVSQVLDMPLKEQQLLLQMRDTGKRLKRQSRMLESARQYLAAQVTIKEAGLKEW